MHFTAPCTPGFIKLFTSRNIRWAIKKVKCSNRDTDLKWEDKVTDN